MGETIDAELHHWNENDMSTAFELLAYLKKGDLVLRDMANFCHRFAKKKRSSGEDSRL